MILQTKHIQILSQSFCYSIIISIRSTNTCPYFADKVWNHVRCVAKLSAHLQVADATYGIAELCQTVGARHQQSHVGSDVAELRRKWRDHTDFRHLHGKSDSRKVFGHTEEKEVHSYFVISGWVVNVDSQNDLSFRDHVSYCFWFSINS